MARAQIECGGCGFTATVAASATEDGRVRLAVECACPAVQALAAQVVEVDPYDFGSFLTTAVYRAADACLRHPDCLVPAGIVRAVNVEAGLALPGISTVSVTRD